MINEYDLNMDKKESLGTDSLRYVSHIAHFWNPPVVNLDHATLEVHCEDCNNIMSIPTNSPFRMSMP